MDCICSLYLVLKFLPVCPVYFFGHLYISGGIYQFCCTCRCCVFYIEGDSVYYLLFYMLFLCLCFLKV
jgi:hypothetical protein